MADRAAVGPSGFDREAIERIVPGYPYRQRARRATR